MTDSPWWGFEGTKGCKKIMVDVVILSIGCSVSLLILAFLAILSCYHRRGCHYCKEEAENGIYTTICLDDDELEEFMDQDYD